VFKLFIVEGTMNISTNKLLRQSALLLGAGLTLQASSSFAARCEYLVQSDWNTGFVAAIRITNDTSTAINGWSVNWTYTDGSTRTGGWNANFSGSNPYTATGVGWNNQINPGQSVEFGVQGNKGVTNSPAARPVVSGSVCSSPVSSPSTSSRSSVPSSRSSSSLPIDILSSSSYSSARSSSSRSASSLPIDILSSSSFSSFHSASSRSLSSFSAGSSSSVRTSNSSFSSAQTTSVSSIGSSSSKGVNHPPIARITLAADGLTVRANALASTDEDGDKLKYSIGFGDGAAISYGDAWHTYKTPGTYTVTVTVNDGTTSSEKQESVTLTGSGSNQPPIAVLNVVRDNQRIIAYANTSYDAESGLSYWWDFGEGQFMGSTRQSFNDCNATTSAGVTLTVSDGQLADTVQGFVAYPCGAFQDTGGVANFTYTIDGLKVNVDARGSYQARSLEWNFGGAGSGGSSSVGAGRLLESYTYAAPGTYSIQLTAHGDWGDGTKIIPVTVGSVASSSSSSSSIRSSSSSSASSVPNHYDAPRATTTPVIDGSADAVWERAAWAPINVFWLGTQSNPSAQDYSGRYKALWDEDYLYLLFDVTDDRIYDGVRDALDRYWEDDTVELFIDENKNGGQHGYNTSAWAYHISTYGDVVDYTTSGPKLLNDHIECGH
jgi:PKD repeat protein